MKDDRNQKNDNNTPLLVLVFFLTLGVIAGGIYFVSKLTGYLNEVQTVFLQEADTENGTDAADAGENNADADIDADETAGTETGTDAAAGTDVSPETETAAGTDVSTDTNINTDEASGASGESGSTDTDNKSGDENEKDASSDTGKTQRGSFGQDETLDIVSVVTKTMPSVVAITNLSVQEVSYMYRGTAEVESVSSGTGIIIGENDTELLIATNYHVVEDAVSLTVCFWADISDEEDLLAEAALKGINESADLAVIAVELDEISDEVLGQVYAATLGSSAALTIGEPAIAIGNALGYGQSVTYGIISALNRSIEVDGVTGNYIQTDAAINAGNSGGALLNAAGEVIGINSAKVSASGVEGMGYAIPIDDARPVLEELMGRETRERADEETRGYLGIDTQDISSETRELYDIPEGVYVSRVESGSPAEDAGLKQGDIISALDGISVLTSDGFSNLMEYYSAGETVEIEIYRANKGSYTAKTLSVTFSEQPEEGGQGQRSTPPFGGMTPSW
ncbi:MAG: trypsin-like peptidase domain-containing protein [Lachnospiraceae bacterium]|nr:trypsin-like peptidase domain-containing protein [Lachnospiraceae bacterium]